MSPQLTCSCFTPSAASWRPAAARWWGALALQLVLQCFVSMPAWAQKTPGVSTSTAKATRATPSGKAKPNAAGTIDLYSGTIAVTTAKGTPRDVTAGMTIEVGDTIATEDDSEAHATMADGAYLAVRANSSIKIDAYAANGNAKDKSWIKLITGSLRTVTGWIAKSRPSAYRVTTSTATVGVRGTDHEVVFLSEEDAPTPEEAGTYNVVFQGATTLETASGSVDVNVGQAAFILPKTLTPQLYAEQIPAFLSRVRGQYDSDLLQHRGNIEDIMQRGLIDKGLMRNGQNLQDVFKSIGGEGGLPNSGRNGIEQRQIQGVQSEITKQIFGGGSDPNAPMTMPFGMSGPGNTNGPPPISIPSPGGGRGGAGMPFVPR